MLSAVPYVALLLCIAGTLAALISIMAFFLGTEDGVIRPWVHLQLAIALLLVPCAVVSLGPLRAQHSSVLQAVRSTPGWLIVATVVVLSLMLLGELSVLIARYRVGEVTRYLDHLPSICIVIFCLSFWLHAMALLGRPQDPFPVPDRR